MSIILLPDTFIAQYFFLTMSTLANMMLISYKKPFKEVNRNRAVLLDEVYIIFFMYHMLGLTEFVPEESTRSGIGYSAITCVMLHFLCTYIVLF